MAKDYSEKDQTWLAYEDMPLNIQKRQARLRFNAKTRDGHKYRLEKGNVTKRRNPSGTAWAGIAILGGVGLYAAYQFIKGSGGDGKPYISLPILANYGDGLGAIHNAALPISIPDGGSTIGFVFGIHNPLKTPQDLGCTIEMTDPSGVVTKIFHQAETVAGEDGISLGSTARPMTSRTVLTFSGDYSILIRVWKDSDDSVGKLATKTINPSFNVVSGTGGGGNSDNIAIQLNGHNVDSVPPNTTFTLFAGLVPVSTLATTTTFFVKGDDGLKYLQKSVNLELFTGNARYDFTGGLSKNQGYYFYPDISNTTYFKRFTVANVTPIGSIDEISLRMNYNTVSNAALPLVIDNPGSKVEFRYAVQNKTTVPENMGTTVTIYNPDGSALDNIVVLAKSYAPQEIGSVSARSNVNVPAIIGMYTIGIHLYTIDTSGGVSLDSKSGIQAFSVTSGSSGIANLTASYSSGVVLYSFNGFQPNQVVTITVAGGGYVTATADGSGHGWGQFQDGDPAGIYYLTATDSYGHSTNANFNIPFIGPPAPTTYDIQFQSDGSISYGLTADYLAWLDDSGILYTIIAVH